MLWTGVEEKEVSKEWAVEEELRYQANLIARASGKANHSPVHRPRKLRGTAMSADEVSVTSGTSLEQDNTSKEHHDHWTIALHMRMLSRLSVLFFF